MRLVNTVLMERVVEWDKKILILTARTMEHLEQILELPRVKAINLELSSKSHLTNEDICKLLEKSSHLLKLLKLSYTKFSGDTFSTFNLQLEKLETLVLTHSKQLTDRGLSALLSSCGQKLKTLDLGYTKVSGESMVESNLQLNNLQTLVLIGCEKLSDSGLFAMLSICGQGLNSLDLRGTNVTGESLVESNLQMNKLESLVLRGCKQLTDRGLHALLTICGQRMNYLNLGGTNVSLALLADWMEQQPLLQLREMRLFSRDNETAADVARLAAVMPNCEINYYY